MSENNNFILTNQVRSEGGKARAAKLTSEERRAIAIKASSSRKCIQNLPKATHIGVLDIAKSKISCAVLEDGRRVITETSMHEILGKSRRGRSKGEKIPHFLASKNLKALIPSDLIDGKIVVEFVGRTGKKSYGYEAVIIPEICKVFLDARENKMLNQVQLGIARTCEIILHSLAKTGIVALVDEATGYQYQRENDELQKLLTKFIAKELQPWAKKFPDSFFSNIKRIYGLEQIKGSPQFVGHLINKYIYDELNPEILIKLKEINPFDPELGRRKHRHHQHLTEEIGHPALSAQIRTVDTLLAISETKEEFFKFYDKFKRK